MKMTHLLTLRVRLAALAACLIFGAVGWTFGEVPAQFGGGGGTSGDTVGSLPMMSAPGAGFGSESLGDVQAKDAGPAVPSFALIGDEFEILDMILDAYPTGPDGAFERIPLDDSRVRYQFIGRLTVLLDRAKFSAGDVRAEIVTGASFHGGVASVEIGGVKRAEQVLLQGVKDMRLALLDAAGVLSEGLVWHAVSPTDHHRIVAVKALNNTLRIDQRD